MITRSALPAAMTVAAFLMASGNLGAQDEVNLTGKWYQKSSPTDPPNLAIQITHEGNEVTAKFKAVQDNAFQIREGDDILKGTFSGTEYDGSIRMWAQDEVDHTPILKDGKPVWMWTGCKLTYDEATGALSGTYDKFPYENKDWGEVAKKATVYFAPPCPPRVTGPIHIGRGNLQLKIDLDEAMIQIPHHEDEESRKGFCHYISDRVANISFEFPGLTEKSKLTARVPAIDIEFYLKEGADPSDRTAYQDISLTWSDNETGAVVLFEKWGVSFVLYSIDITFQMAREGKLYLAAGGIEVQMDAAGHVHLKGPVYLSGNLSGLIRYDWNHHARSWTDGSWSFSDFGAKIQLEVRRNGSVPLARATLSFSEGRSPILKLELMPQKTFKAAGFEFTLVDCSLTASFDTGTFDIELLGGEITGTIKLPKMESAFGFKLEYVKDEPVEGKPDEFRSYFKFTLETKGDFDLFGGTCSGRVTSSMDPNKLVLLQIEFEGKWKHKKFDTGIEVVQLLWKDGELKVFECNGRVSFQQKTFTLDIQLLRYEVTKEATEEEESKGKISVKGSLDLGWKDTGVVLKIEELTINEKGEIVTFDILGGLQIPAVHATIRAWYKADINEIGGEVDIKITGVGQLKGDFKVGKNPQPEFVYGWLSFELEAKVGVFLGQTGLKLVGIQGKLGINYLPERSLSRPKGGPEEGAFYIAAGLTITDVPQMMGIKGTLALELGKEAAISINGRLTIPYKEPMLIGEAETRYGITRREIDGFVKMTVTIPKNGAIVNIQENQLNYKINVNKWTIDAKELGGIFFSVLTISEGEIHLENALLAPITSMEGTLKATLSAKVGKELRIERGGFKLVGSVNLSVAGKTSVTLGSSGFSGEIGLKSRGDGRIELTTPEVIFFGSVSFAEKVSIWGEAKLSQEGTKLMLSADLHLRVGSELVYDFEIKGEF